MHRDMTEGAEWPSGSRGSCSRFTNSLMAHLLIFLQGFLVAGPHCRAWCLIRGEQPVAAIWYQCAAEQAEMIDLQSAGLQRDGKVLGVSSSGPHLTALEGRQAPSHLEVRCLKCRSAGTV